MKMVGVLLKDENLYAAFMDLENAYKNYTKVDRKAVWIVFKSLCWKIVFVSGISI